MAEMSNWRQKSTDQKSTIQQQAEIEFPCIIPASANWYLNSVSSTLNGYVSYGGRSSVIIINMKMNPPVVEKQWQVCPNKNKKPDKVTSTALISFTDNNDVDAVAISSDTGLIRIYKIEGQKIFKENTTHKSCVVALGWSEINNDILVGGDEKGKVSLWNFHTNTVEMWTPKEGSISCLQTSPKTKGIVTIGYKDGSIVTGNICQKEKTIAIFKCHQNEVTSISWSIFFTKGDFVSASKDQDVKAWKVGHKKAIKSFESQPPKGKKRQPFRKTAFTCTCWYKEDTVLIGQQNGMISMWDLETGKVNNLPSLPKGDIYSVLHDKISNSFICFAACRSIHIFNCNNFKNKTDIATNNGYIYGLTISPLDSNCITIGAADGVIKSWSFGNIENAYNYSLCDMKNPVSKPLTVLFHPSKEGVYAFGAYSGHVGIYNVLSNHKNVSATVHEDKVYSVCWGPSPIDKSDDDGDPIVYIYSVGDTGQMYAHNAKDFKKPAVNLNQYIKERNETITFGQAAEIAWKPDFSLLALGNKDGSINIFTNDFKCILKIEVHKSAINCLCWHHEVDQDAQAGSITYSNLLASSSDDSNVCVTDITSCLSSHAGDHSPQLLTSPFRKFDGHTMRVYGLSWNPHEEGILASAANDETVQVWNVIKDEPIGNFREHSRRVQSVTWSLNDPDVIYSGGEDCAVRRWRVSELTNKIPPEVTKTKPKKQIPATVKFKPDSAKDTSERSTKTFDGGVSEVDKPKIIRKEEKEGFYKKVRRKSMFPMSSKNDSKNKELMQNDCILLAQYLKAEQDEPGSGYKETGIQPGCEEYSNLGMYTTRKDVLRLIDYECKGFEGGVNIDYQTQLGIWKFSIVDLVNKAIEEKTLTERLALLSAMGGQEMWRATVVALAQQLEESNDFQHAAMYYIALGNSRKAVEVLKENNLLKEAIILANAHLPKGDPLITDIYRLRANKAMVEISFERAAECYLAIGEIDQAVAALAKRGDSKALLTAYKVAKIYNKKELERMYFARCIESNIENRQWNECNDLMKGQPNVDTIFELQIVIGEVLDKLFTDEQSSGDSSLMESEEMVNSRSGHENETFMDTVEKVRVLVDNNFSLVERAQYQRMSMDELIATSPSYNRVFQHITNHVIVAIMNLLLHKCDVSIRHLLKICNSCLTNGYIELLHVIICFILPNMNTSFQYIVNNYREHCTSPGYVNTFANFNAYFLATCLYKLWWSNDYHMSGKYFENACSVEYDKSESVFSLLAHVTNVLTSPVHAELKRIEGNISLFENRLKKSDDKMRNVNLAVENGKPKDEQNVNVDSMDQIKTRLQCLNEEKSQMDDYLKHYCYPLGDFNTMLPVMYICLKFLKTDEKFRHLFDDVKSYILKDQKVNNANMRYLETISEGCS